MKQKIEFEYDHFSGIDDLTGNDRELLHTARTITHTAYAPYSKFKVGAAALLQNGQVVTGTNQENASYPVGTCAERVLLGTASVLFPEMPILTMAISYHNLQGDSSRPISPCGMCRQALIEFQERTGQVFRLILSGQNGNVLIVSSAQHLLPLSFGSADMQ